MSQPFVLRLASTSIALLACTAFAGCSHKSVKPDTTDSLPTATTPTTATSEDFVSSDRGNAFGLETVHFRYDSSLLDADAKKTLRVDAEILKRHPSLRVQIEGHCDQRGGIQYNIALGEKRAKAAEHFLEDLGISGGRISTISFGKERPLDSAETEEAYAKNRRANLVVTKTIG